MLATTAPMNGKRDFVTELKAYVERSALAEKAGVYEPEWVRLNDIIATFAAIREVTDEKIRDELRRQMVVSLVAVIQGSARSTIAGIVDAKEECGEQLPEFQHVRITLAMVRELKNRQFSVGEFVAHLSSLNGFEQISAALQHACAQDLNTTLLNRFRDQARPIDGLKNPQQAVATARAQILSLFTYRNIYCHESGIGISVKDQELYEFIVTTITVVTALGLLRAKWLKL